MSNKTKATTIIAGAANLINEGEAADICIGVQLATGLHFDYNAAWNKLPMGIGSEIVSFAKSKHYTERTGNHTYGAIARAFLQYRIGYLDGLR